MDSSYDAVTRTNDAVKFAESRFGKHHLRRLKRQRERHVVMSMDVDNYSKDFRADMAVKASVYQKELDYFATACKVKEDPKLMQRLIDKLKRKEEDPDQM